jgi:hypothetical protein
VPKRLQDIAGRERGIVVPAAGLAREGAARAGDLQPQAPADA